jgi:TonB-dependent receptor
MLRTRREDLTIRKVCYSLQITAFLLLCGGSPIASAQEAGNLPAEPRVENWTEMQVDLPNLQQTEYLSFWLSLNLTDVPIREVLNKISSMTGVDFSYSENAVPVDRKISINVEHVTLAEALNEVFATTNSTWVAMAGNHIVIIERKEDQQGSGNIKGKVYDAESKAPLPGATVLVKGTSIGAATDVDGNFVVHSVPSGEQTIVVSYIGYQTTTEVVTVQSGQTLIKDFYLAAVAVQGKAVVVTAQAAGQMQAINQQLSSNTIVNVVSADKIRQLPDASASAALSRLPGVSIMNGDQIVIRGLQAKDNIILLNGVQLPSTDLNTRSVDLGFISSNMLSGIEVIKAVTPDMDANVIGGVVNLNLMEAPPNFHMDVLAQGDYNSQAHTTDDYKVWASASDRFFDNKFGIFIQGNADRTDGGNDQTTAAYQDYGSGLDHLYEMSTYTWDQQVWIPTNYGGSLNLDYALPHGKIMLQNTFTRNLNDDIDYEHIAGLSGQQTGLLNFTAARNDYDRDLDIDALQVENDFGSVKVDLTLSHSYSNQHTNIRYGDPGDFFGFTNSNNNQPFLNANGTPVNMTYLTGIGRDYLTPGDMNALLVNPAYADSADLENWATLRYNDFTQHFYNSALDFTIPVSFSPDVTATFKLGGKFDRTTRVNNLTEYYKRTGDPDMWTNAQNFLPGISLIAPSNPLRLYMIENNDYTRGKYFLNGTYDLKDVIDIDEMDALLPLAATGWVTEPHFENSNRYNFNGTEIFSAGYLMGTFDVGPRLTLLAGARYEFYNMNYHASFLYVTHDVDGLANLYDTLNATNRNDYNLLPNVQLRYKFTDWCDLRLAYTNTLVRPDYNAIMPNVLFDPGTTAEAGNPLLEPTNSKNYDAILSFYNNDIGLLTIGGYYKHLTNVFFFTTIYYQNLKDYNAWFPDSAAWESLGVTPPAGSAAIQTYLNNPYPGHVEGLELEWQTRFWYLPQPLSYLVLDVNYTRTWSGMDYQEIVDVDSTYKVGRFTYHDYLSRSETYNERLLDQSNDVVNVSLGADYEGFSGRISFNMQGNVITSVGATPDQDQFTGNIYTWDISLQQKLPLKGLSIAFNVQNLTHQPIYTYESIRRVEGGPIGNNIENTSYAPRFLELNLRYSL